MAVLGGIASIVLYGALYILVLGIVIVVHELGHFLVGRWCGVRIETFSLGFGRELAHWIDRRGTRWRVAAFPLGGYVKFAGDLNAASVADDEAIAAMSPEERAGTLQAKSVGARAAIVAAGPIANFVLALVVLTGLYLVVGRYDLAPIVGSFVENSAAEAAGVKVGDRIVAIDGTRIDSFLQIWPLVTNRTGEHLALSVERGGVELNFDVVPRLQEKETDLGVQRRGLIGIAPDNAPGNLHHVDLGPWGAFLEACSTIKLIVNQTLGFFGRLFSGHEYVDQLSGVARMAHLVAASAQMGFGVLVEQLAFLSVSIGLLNLFPIPVLDGGHLVFYFFEAIRGRPLSERVQDVGLRIGLTFVLALMLVANGNDLIHYGGRLLSNWVR
ncbi:MAG: RIP metalloprotease RseP [Ancalomicrobiaceae bacterium]|nr:RIP metalloprotease RseP [Ancalomicrobiaceae bacterium]